MGLDNLLGDALISISMLPIEHDDPINAKMFAISEDKIDSAFDWMLQRDWLREMEV